MFVIYIMSMFYSSYVVASYHDDMCFTSDIRLYHLMCISELRS